MRTPSGDLRGDTEGGVGVWRGVPYAEQPVGPRRFQAPGPLKPWSGIRDAREHGPLPPQTKSFVGGGRDDPKVRDEACLTLTVWSPDTAASLPVMVWIPGGAFVYGAGQFQLYNGSRLAANGNVVVVNLTYRIGVFGGFELGDLGEGQRAVGAVEGGEHRQRARGHRLTRGARVTCHRRLSLSGIECSELELRQVTVSGNVRSRRTSRLRSHCGFSP